MSPLDSESLHLPYVTPIQIFIFVVVREKKNLWANLKKHWTVKICMDY